MILAILSEDAKLILTAKKKPRSTMVQNALTSEKDYKPRNLNDMWDDLKGMCANPCLIKINLIQ